MNHLKTFCMLLLASSLLFSCSNSGKQNTNVIFLHHSTGQNVWNGDKGLGYSSILKKSLVPKLVKQYNADHKTNISISERAFPSGSPYPWENYPYDYYNIWVKNGDKEFYEEEPTLKTLTKEYNVIVFKHCFPGSNIVGDDLIEDQLSIKTLGNYKYLYNQLKDKLHEYPDTKFIVWTNAALVASATNEEEATRTKEWVRWVKEEWDTPNDNIYVFDFYSLETEGGLYIKPQYATGTDDSHPNQEFSVKAANKFVEFLTDVINK